MSLTNHRITDAAIERSGVVAAPDRLTGTAAQNKMVFDRLIREAVRSAYNGLIDELASAAGAGDIGASAIDGVVGGDVQTVLGSLKTILDTKPSGADMTAALSLKSDKSVTDAHIKSVSFNAQTGVFTFTRENGGFVTVDTALEKVATNWRYDPQTQSLALTLIDGTTQTVPLSAFITETEFADSAQLAFSVSNHCVTATVKAGSITDTMLSSALIAQLDALVSDAADSAVAAAQSQNAAASAASAASGSALDSEAWAVGERSGIAVDSTDPAYRNSAKYWAESAAASAAAHVAAHDADPDAHANLYIRAGRLAGTSLGGYATAEGLRTTASGYVSHAEGWLTTASGRFSHAGGQNSVASGYASYAEGWYTEARGKYSNAQGTSTVATHASQHVFGAYNLPDPSAAAADERGTYVEIVGIGSSEGGQANGRTLDWSGNERLAGRLTLGADPANPMDAATKRYADSAAAALRALLDALDDRVTALERAAPQPTQTMILGAGLLGSATLG